MIYSVNCTALSSALEELKIIVKNNEEKGLKTVIFCEDRLTLAAERTVCAEVGGTFLTSVYTFARFLSSERGKPDNVLSGQGSAMAVRKIIEERKNELTLFKKLSAAGAAQTVYDTIALLYSSRVTAEDAFKAGEGGGLLGGKLRDLALVYSEYQNYLNKSGKQDRNAYLRQLPEVIESSSVIRGGAVVFLGFQTLTCMARECVRACFGVAESVYGLFIGGSEDIYVNEAAAGFCKTAEEFGGAQSFVRGGMLCDEAEVLRRSLFNPESFYAKPVPTDKITVFEACDEEEEMEFIAASIKKHIAGGERYAKISVMLPDPEKGERTLSRVFSRFEIPYYADRQRPLSEHPLCAFVTGYIACILTGCAFTDVDGVVASPYFPADIRDKDLFRNYLLRYANYRGGVRRAPRPDTDNIESIERVRSAFLNGLSLLGSKSVGGGICGGVRRLLEEFGVKDALDRQVAAYADEKPVAAEFSARAYESVLSVLSEAESIAPENIPLNEFLKILKSGFAAMKVSLIPPKADAVFVGDLSETANTGSHVVFAARLTGDVPASSADTSLLTDREIAALEAVNLNISPKIRQVNARRKETCALNACAFGKRLYLTYPARLGGEECAASEIIAYAQAAFVREDGAKIKPVESAKMYSSPKAAAYYCSERMPALKFLRRNANSAVASAVYEVLKRKGFEKDAREALEKPVKRGISCGKRLYLGKSDSLSPTALETYFLCPYLGFVRQGLKAAEREEGAVRAVDTGNFIHAVLQDLAKEVNAIEEETVLTARAEQLAREKLAVQPYASLADSKSGEYVSEALVSEAVKVSQGMYEQLKNSSFTVLSAESPAEVYLSDGVKIYGRIDRVDESGDLVRVVDYKTGAIDPAPYKYYTGVRLQLPLYLLSASKGRRAAGAYYFPAAVDYREKPDGTFRLQGFMDGSDEVVEASDVTVKPKEKSGYIDAYYKGRKLDSAMPAEDFPYFLNYARLVADNGAREMLGGNVTPSPAENACSFCSAGGSCALALGKDGEERKNRSVKCSQIAEIAKKESGV